MGKYYQFAGVELAVSIPEHWDYNDDRTLAPFRMDTATDPHWFSFRTVETLSPPEGTQLAVLPDYTVYGTPEAQVRYVGTIDGQWQKATMRAEHRGREHSIQLKKEHFPAGMTAKTLLNSCATEHLVARENGFIFHSSYIEWNGKAILFTAPSGTGKSTQAELWRSLRGAEIINGDRSAVRVTEAGAVAGGIPFSGSSQICKNRTLPLAAIVYLAQAPVTSIRKLRGAEAFRRIWEGVSVNTWDGEDLRLVSGTVQKVAENVPVFYMPCTPDETAVIALEEVLKV